MSRPSRGERKFAQDLTTGGESRRWILYPREHGAWGMLLLPFLAGAILGKNWNADLAVSLMAVLLAFIIREPLTILARQRWVWRLGKPETETAKRALLWQTPLLLLCGFYLWTQLPKAPLAAMAAAGFVMTVAAVWMALHNLSRSIALQIISALTLSSTGLLAALAATSRLESWAWQLWALMSLHSMVGTFNVHARIEKKLEGKTGRPSQSAAMTKAFIALLLALAVGAWFTPYRASATPLAFSAALAAIELRRLSAPGAFQEPFTRVGLRMLSLSIAHLAVAVVALWPEASV